MFQFILLFACAGILAMTWLFPMIAIGWQSLIRIPAARNSQARASSFGRREIRRVAVLIPAHDDELGLQRTLETVRRSAEIARSADPELDVVIHVGIDGCTDESEQVARRFGARVTLFNTNQGKWRTLGSLFRRYRESVDWVALADCGIRWDATFLAEALEAARRPGVMAVAPTYRPSRGGMLEALVWAVERHFKSLEARLAGGPMSVHGATVLYRAPQLDWALSQLEGRQWLNDDIVIPLMMRAGFPAMRIEYLAGCAVRDNLSIGAARGAKPPRELGRRRRMVLGNLQWIRAILPQVFRTNPVAGILALRRVARMLWAYWALALGLGLELAALERLGDRQGALTLITLTAAAVFGPALVASLRRPAIKAYDAGRASLLAPYYLLARQDSERTAWK